MKYALLIAALALAACEAKPAQIQPLVGNAAGAAAAEPAAAKPVKVVPLSGNAKAHGGAK